MARLLVGPPLYEALPGRSSAIIGSTIVMVVPVPCTLSAVFLAGSLPAVAAR